MITDEQLETDFLSWLDHYSKHGWKHYEDTSEERILEMYYDNIVERV